MIVEVVSDMTGFYHMCPDYVRARRRRRRGTQTNMVGVLVGSTGSTGGSGGSGGSRGGQWLFEPVESLAATLEEISRRTDNTSAADEAALWYARASAIANTQQDLYEAAVAGAAAAVRVRFHIIRNARIENVVKSQSCMVSFSLPVIRRRLAGL